jgi:hypothetical protein
LNYLIFENIFHNTSIDFTFLKIGYVHILKWIDGPDKWNSQILLFLYDRTESSPYRTFKRWVPLPSNLPPITNEKDEATACCICNPPLCKCGYRSELANSPMGLDYTPFWRCAIPLLVIVHKRKYLLL